MEIIDCKINIGDMVVITVEELNYGDQVGVVTDIIPDNIDNLPFQVTFDKYYDYMDEPWYKGERGKFVEYFSENELKVVPE